MHDLFFYFFQKNGAHSDMCFEIFSFKDFKSEQTLLGLKCSHDFYSSVASDNSERRAAKKDDEHFHYVFFSMHCNNSTIRWVQRCIKYDHVTCWKLLITNCRMNSSRPLYAGKKYNQALGTRDEIWWMSSN